LIADLFALYLIEKDLAVYISGGYFSAEQATMIRDLILELCGKFKGECISVVDAIAPPDEIIWSPLGQSNGLIYKNLFNMVRTAPKTFERPEYWALLRTPVNPGSMHSKL
jgi:acyl-CoA oxidase